RAHVAGHANALLGLAALAAPRGARRDRTGRAVLALGAVRRGLATKVVPLHDAGRPLALARPDDIDVLHAFEDVDLHFIARLLIGGLLEADLAEVLLRPDARLGSVTDQPERAELRLDVAEAELNGVIPVALDRLHLSDRARPRFHDGHGHDRALVV